MTNSSLLAKVAALVNEAGLLSLALVRKGGILVNRRAIEYGLALGKERELRKLMLLLALLALR